MEIRLPKIDIKCPECDTKIDEFIISGADGYHGLISECNNCGLKIEIDIVFEETPKFCNCEVCKKLKN